MTGWSRETTARLPARAAAMVVLLLGACGCAQLLGIHELPPESDGGTDGSFTVGSGGSASAGGSSGAGLGAGGMATGRGGAGGMSSCMDGQQNGNEKGIDCGGTCLKVCLGAACSPTGSPCARGACWGGTCRLCGQTDNCTCEVSGNSRLYMKCYDEGRRKSWLNAQQACRNEGMELASIGGAQENSYVVGTHDSGGDFWVGGSSTEGSWMWADGTMVGEAGYTNWDNGQPLMSNTCMAVAMGSQKWTSADCTLPKDFLCEQN
jgi:hypothetical protein